MSKIPQITVTEPFKDTASWFFDFRVQITPKQLDSLEFQHLFTMLDDQVFSDAPDNALHAGITEWTANVKGQELTIGWDWYVCKLTGEVHILDLVEPRSNLRLIGEWGQPFSEHQQSKLCLDRLLRKFWHDEVYCACPKAMLM